MRQPKLGFLGPENDKERLQQRLREAREYMGISQAKVAEYLEIPRSAVSELETGKRTISALELQRLAKLYQKPASWFTEDFVEGVPADVEFLARTATELSQTDRGELQKFAEFLKSKSKVADDAS